MRKRHAIDRPKMPPKGRGAFARAVAYSLGFGVVGGILYAAVVEAADGGDLTIDKVASAAALASQELL